MITIFCSISQEELKKTVSWLIPSLERQQGISKIDLVLINYSGKGTVYNEIAERGIVTVKEINNGTSLGFGEAHNFAFSNIKPKKYFLIINPDVYLHENCISEMINTMENDQKIGIVEARQLPFEHPKEYNKRTGETPWASGFCSLIKSEFFEKEEGFDDKFWMYCEDVDLSWRAWLNGYKVIYNPFAVAYHFTGLYFGYMQTRYYLEQFWSARNFLYLMFKYWGKGGTKKARKYLEGTSYPENFKTAVFNSSESLKNSIIGEKPLLDGKIKERLKKHIKVVGFNQYHKMN